LILGTFFVATAVQNTLLKLFCTNITPDPNGGDVVATYDAAEATGGAYASKTLARGTWVVTPADDPSDAIYPAQAFVFDGPLTTNPSIYGYYVTNAAGTVLLWAEKLAAVYTPTADGDTLSITPKLQISFGTPAA
jgi:hypothetical protein